MNQKKKCYFKAIDNIISRVFYYAMIILACYTFAVTMPARFADSELGPKYFGESYQDIESNTFIFGYRPVYVLTGSMEPYMMTNSIVMTKEITDISELAVGDVISFRLKDNDRNTLRITHRIIDIDGDFIYTKGDNNNVDDGIPLTIDNVEAKVTSVYNQLPWLINKWDSGAAGKIMIISFITSFILLYFLIKNLIKDYFEGKYDIGIATVKIEDNTTNLLVATIVDRCIWGISLGCIVFSHWSSYGFVKYVKIELIVYFLILAYFTIKFILYYLPLKNQKI